MSAGDHREGGGSCTDAADLHVRATEALVGLFASLVEKTDLSDLLQEFTERCADLLGAVEVDVLLLTPAGDLSLIASSCGEGAFMDGAAARSDRATHVLPLRHANERLGTVDVFHVDQIPADETYRRVAQALADVAGYAIGQARALQRATDLAGQLQEALASRIAIEQAKGILAEQLQMDVSESFAVLRRYARSRSMRVAEVAADVVARRLSGGDLVDGVRSRRPRGEPPPHRLTGSTS